MKSRTPRSGVWAAVGMLLLILDGKTALAGARTGVELCINTVIPSLFPFFVLSGLLSKAVFPFLRPLGRLYRMPEGSEYLLVPAFLGGYPVGARSVAAAWKAGTLEKEDAQRLLAYCSNAGPAFLFGMASALFPKPQMAWVLWGIHLTAAVMVARLLPPTARNVAPAQASRTSLSEALSAALRVMGLVCGWVVLFRVVIAFLQRWVFFLFPAEVQVALTGLLELANGCFELPKVKSLPLRFTLCAGMLAAGGLCVTMQTVSVTRGLSLKFYFLGKGLQILFSLALCGCIFRGDLFLPVTVLVYMSLLLANKKKRSSIRKPIGV